jgi:hypothetical protein
VNRAPVAPRRGGALVALFAAGSFAFAACSSAPISTTGPRASGATLPTSSAAPLGSFGPPPSPTAPDDTTAIELDPALLAILPASVEGIPVQEDADEAGSALSDPALPRIATAVDGAVAFDGGANLVYAWVVRLRPGVFTDPDFRQWRDAYDEGACAGAGGVVGRAEAQIGGRTAYVTSCAAGLHTYHVWLKEQDTLISASSIGDAHFGEKLLEGLRVPSS